MASSPETAVKVSIAPCGFASGGSPSRSKANCRVVPLPPDAGSGMRQRPIGRRPFDKEIDRRARGRRKINDNAVVRAAGYTMHGENGKTLIRSGLWTKRHAPWHANFRLLDRCVFGAVAVECELQIGFDRDA